MDDLDLVSLADRFGTPVFLFDERAIARRIDKLKSALPDTCELCYAVKANPFIIPEVARRVARLEVCSPGEMVVCRSVGAPSSKIVVSGVHKDAALIEQLVARRVRPCRFTIESVAQLELIDEIARRLGARLPVLVRLSSGNQFGVDRATLVDIIARRVEYQGLDFVGIQYFSGTQKSRAKRLAREVARLDELLCELSRDYGWEARELEYGPGLAVAYFKEDAFDEDELLEALANALSGMTFSGGIVLELGRSIAAACGTYLTRVVDAKESGRARYAILDGGINHLVYFGHSLGLHQPPCRVVEPSGSATVPPASHEAPREETEGAPSGLWNLCGSLCTANDVLARQVDLPGLGEGSLLAFDLAGAYCMTEGISLFLSRDLPAVALIDANGEARLVREATPTYPLNTPRCSL